MLEKKPRHVLQPPQKKEVKTEKEYYVVRDIPLYIVTRTGVMEMWLYRPLQALNVYAYRVGSRHKQKVLRCELNKTGFFDVKLAIASYKEMMYVEISRLRTLADNVEEHTNAQIKLDEIKFSQQPAVYQGRGIEISRIIREHKRRHQEERARLAQENATPEDSDIALELDSNINQ